MTRHPDPEPHIVWFKDPSKEPEETIVVNPETRLEIGSSLESTSWDPAQEGIQISTLYRYKHEDVNGITHYYAIGKSSHNTSGYVPVSNMGICKMVSGQASSLGYGPGLPGFFGVGSDGFPWSTEDINSTLIISLSEKDILRLKSTAEFLTKIKEPTIENPSPGR